MWLVLVIKLFKNNQSHPLKLFQFFLFIRTHFSSKAKQEKHVLTSCLSETLLKLFCACLILKERQTAEKGESCCMRKCFGFYFAVHHDYTI